MVEKKMGQAIITKYFDPTHHNGPLIQATCASGSITIPYNYSLNAFENHEAAVFMVVEALKEQFGCVNKDTKLVAAILPKGDGYCFIMGGEFHSG